MSMLALRRDDTLITIKAPPGTTLEVPHPDETVWQPVWRHARIRAPLLFTYPGFLLVQLKCHKGGLHLNRVICGFVCGVK
jgi:hypothetical protein